MKVEDELERWRRDQQDLVKRDRWMTLSDKVEKTQIDVVAHKSTVREHTGVSVSSLSRGQYSARDDDSKTPTTITYSALAAEVYHDEPADRNNTDTPFELTPAMLKVLKEDLIWSIRAVLSKLDLDSSVAISGGRSESGDSSST